MNKPVPVFLVDDDRDLLRATGQTLELAGFDVRLFTSASTALSELDDTFEGVVVSMGFRCSTASGTSTASCR